MSDAIDRLVRESRPDLGTRQAREVDWAKVDRGLFDRIAQEQRAERAELSGGRGRVWALATAGLAVAAAVALLVGKSRDVRTLAPVEAAGETEAAGSVVSIEGDGQLLVDGKPATVGAELRLGDVLETHGAQATIERPGKLTVVLEEGGRATVTHVQGALVLALERGAVEAQVVPVANGEAFAVDVGSSRVAVHGTHLRVGRTGEHVVVDLNEGVVSLGPAPRIGSTLGSLVTAPAHAEFTAGDEATLVVSHEPGAVRTPSSLAPSAQAKVSRPAPVAAPAHVEPADSKQPAPTGGAMARAEVKPPPAAPEPHAPATMEPEPEPEGAIAAAVSACLTSRPRADNVTVMVSTTVRIELNADGTVHSARFDPAVAPEVNACASGPIFRTRFSHGGSVAVPVDVKVPSSAP